MPVPDCIPLTALQRPLLGKFYRSHRCSIRASAEGLLWVARTPDIVAGLCLTASAHGHWLTGLFVAPAWRSQGIAGHLIQRAVDSVEGPVWLFCHPQLQGFYQRLGFTPEPALPQPLRDRLSRYRLSKPLVALGRAGH